jgi:phage terminase large subunit
MDHALREAYHAFSRSGAPSDLDRLLHLCRRSGNDAKEIVYRLARNDIFILAKLLNFKPTHQQRKLLKAVNSGVKRAAIKSGQGTGKSSASACIAIWRALRMPKSLVVVTAPSMRQCKDVFMSEIRRHLSEAHPEIKKLFKLTQQKALIGKHTRKDDEDETKEPEWGIICVTATSPENAQGYHRDCLTFIVDEASGVERPIIEQIEGTMGQATGDMLHLQIGNPNSPDCAFFDCFHTKRQFWDCHTFNAAESPLVSKDHVAYLKASYGEHSDVVRVRVYGEFPSSAPNAVMALSDLEACTRTDPLAMAKLSDVKQFGIDLARFGSDESAIYRRSGEAIVTDEHFVKQEPSSVVARAFALQEEAGWRDQDCHYVPDADGLGQGVMDMFTRKSRLEFHSAGLPSDQNMFANRMTEAWFGFAKKVKAHRAFLPNDPRLLQQLSTRLYFLRRSDGKLILESKDDYKKRTGLESPDRADGCVMAFYDDSRISLGL